MVTEPTHRQARAGAHAEFLHPWTNWWKIYSTQVLKRRLGFSFKEISDWYREPDRKFPKAVFARRLELGQFERAYPTKDGPVESALVFATVELASGERVDFDYLWAGNTIMHPGITRAEAWTRLDIPDLLTAKRWDIHEVFKSSAIAPPPPPQAEAAIYTNWNPSGLTNLLADGRYPGRYSDGADLGPNDTPLVHTIMRANPKVNAEVAYR